MSGLPRPERAYLDQLADWARRGAVEPAVAVAGLATVLARGEGWPEAASDAVHRVSVDPPPGPVPPPPDWLSPTPWLLGQAYEAVLDHAVRRSRGAFFTPPSVARRLLDVTLEPGAEPAGVGGDDGGPIIDPAVGGGAFLLAAADRLLAMTVAAPATIACDRLHGADLDPVAVAVTRLGLARWAWRAQGGPGTPWPLDAGRHVVVGDALLDDGTWPEADPARPGVVVGNPPFLGQLQRRTARDAALTDRLAERFGPVIRGYVDGAALFLLAACRRRPPGCRIALILPEAVLVTAHCERVRRAVLCEADLRGLWLGGDEVFEGGVRVCAPIFERRDRSAPRPSAPVPVPVRSWLGPDLEAAGALPIDAATLRTAPTWGPLTASLRGLPDTRRPAARGGGRTDGGRTGDLAQATAGFREQFYGLRPHVQDAAQASTDALSTRYAPLVTSGLIDPAVCRWGRTPARFAGRRLDAPVVDLAALEAGNGKLAAWVRARLRPKVLVATQGRVLEAVADPDGRLVPSVPVVSVEPADADDVWRVLAALSSPVATLWALEHYGGAALSVDAVKLSARQVLAVPTPSDEGGWSEAAWSCRLASEAAQPDRRRRHLLDAAWQSCLAHGLDAAETDKLVKWWDARMRREDPENPRRSP